VNTQRIKSYVLFSLVIMSFVLTTRIWFNTSIEGLFVMQQKNSLQTDLVFDNESLLKPSKMVVHTGQNHMILFNNIRDKDYYNFILNDTKDTIRDWLINYEGYTLSSLPKTELNELRKKRAIELVFDYHIELENIKGIELESIKSLLDIEKNPWNDITNISSIIVSPFENRIYIIDENKDSIYQFVSTQRTSVLTGVITEIEKRNGFFDVFLNDYNKADDELYGDFAIVPLSITAMPILKVKNEIQNEIQLENKLDLEVAEFFNGDDDDIDNIISIKDIDGKVTFTDQEEVTVTIDAKGALEYYKYNISPNNTEFTPVNEALEIATQYVNNHLGYPYDFYLSNIKSDIQGGRTFYIISFDYKYNGIPVVTDIVTGSSAIEVEILGKEVKRYKRDVRVIEDQGQTVSIINSFDILNMVWGKLDNYLNINKSESIVVLNDIYLAYFEGTDALEPVWVVDVRVENKASMQYDRKFIIGAEKGAVLEESKGEN
jgi:regulatory protein YycH of two-component signal transduction system YycFG